MLVIKEKGNVKLVREEHGLGRVTWYVVYVDGKNVYSHHKVIEANKVFNYYAK